MATFDHPAIARQDGYHERYASCQKVRGRPADIERREQGEQGRTRNRDQAQKGRRDL